MAWYTTGTIAVSGTTVTGTGTNWTDNKQGIGPGQALLIPGSGTVKMYEIASVTSATKLTLKTSAGTIAAGQAYAILSFYTDSVPDFARRLAAQLSYYQSQMDGWQKIMTGSGSISLTAPDGTAVTISSFSKLTSDISSALKSRGLLRNAGVTTVDALGPVDPYLGIWNCAGSTDYSIAGLPEATAGILEVFDAGAFNGMQKYTTRYGTVYVRCPAATWSASSPSWSSWQVVGEQPVQGYISTDLNNVLSPGLYSVTSAANINGPQSAGLTGILKVEVRLSTNSVKQTFTTIVSGTSVWTNRTWQRTLSGTSWSEWAEIITSNDSRITGALQKAGGNMSGTLNSDTTGTSFVATASGRFASGDNQGNDLAVAYLNSKQYMSFGVWGTPTNILTRIVTWNTNYHVFGFYDNGNGTCDGSWIGASDERHKDNIQLVQNPLKEVLGWRGCTYDKKDIGPSVGLIAQDVEKSCPTAVTNIGKRTFSDGTVIEDFKALDTAGVAAAYHTEAIKALFSLVELALTDPDAALKHIDEIKAAAFPASQLTE